jgi:hypothetical protein
MFTPSFVDNTLFSRQLHYAYYWNWKSYIISICGYSFCIVLIIGFNILCGLIRIATLDSFIIFSLHKIMEIGKLRQKYKWFKNSLISNSTLIEKYCPILISTIFFSILTHPLSFHVFKDHNEFYFKIFITESRFWNCGHYIKSFYLKKYLW